MRRALVFLTGTRVFRGRKIELRPSWVASEMAETTQRDSVWVWKKIVLLTWGPGHSQWQGNHIKQHQVLVFWDKPSDTKKKSESSKVKLTTDCVTQLHSHNLRPWPPLRELLLELLHPLQLLRRGLPSAVCGKGSKVQGSCRARHVDEQGPQNPKC